MSELFMECVEEELEPWQKPAPEVHLIEDDDDEPIFVGELSNSQKRSHPAPVQKDGVGKQTIPSPAPQPVLGSSIMLPLNVVGNRLNTPAPSLTTLTPQPVIVNNQGFIVTSPSLNSGDFIASLGAKYPPGTKFAIVQAGQPQFIQQVNPGTALPGAVHRPQVQKISNNIVTLSNVQSPAVYSANSNLVQVAMPVKTESNNRGPVTKRELLPKQVDSAKKVKLDLSNETEPVENVVAVTKCTKCQEQFQQLDALNAHMTSCSAGTETTDRDVTANNKRIMLVSEFYYGRFEGDGTKKEEQKTVTFKCQSCLKVLKNNIRFMNHMKHHLELEKQNSESWENHTTCQHCYRQYMTPFQLQCHIESAHSPIESTTNCKICELAFESEQVLLEHMKNTHKPGEMPYACQVCNYRSSFFSEVETHFRKVHENTKDLLCPFCLKVQRSSHIYMQHYMKHQRKGIYRCGKCRLNFLTYKEKVEHRTFAHKTFKKPKALEGLPPGTKVTIRASLSGKTSSVPSAADRSGVTVSSETQSFSDEAKSSTKSKSNGAGKGNRRPPTKFNMSLRNLSVREGRYTCVECNTEVDDFFSHYMIASNCGACKYQTSCKVAIGNHMIRNHSKISKRRFARRDQHKRSLPNLILVCLNCDLLVTVLNSDLMAKHLTDRPNHVCKVIAEKDVKAQARAHPDLKPPAKDETPPPAPKQSDMQPVGSVTSGCRPLSEELLPAVSPERVDEEGTCSALSSCAIHELSDTSADKSDLRGHGEEPPTSPSVPEQETEKPELKSP